jgi:UbiD family decarboxylase
VPGVVNSLSSRKLALTLGLPPGETKMDFVKIWKDYYKKIKPIPPKFVKDCPLLENVYREGEIDMFKFPTPKWHDKDGGRYIGTGSVDITRDPDEGWVNYGTYRVMIHDKNKVGFYISPGKHGRIQREKYAASGQPFKMAMSFGHDPLTFLVGSIEVPRFPNMNIWAACAASLEMIEGSTPACRFRQCRDCSRAMSILTPRPKDLRRVDWLLCQRRTCRALG